MAVDYNPDLQGKLAKSNLTLADIALNDNIPSFANIRSVYGEDNALRWLKVQFDSLNDYAEQGKGITDTQLDELCILVLGEYYWMNLAEICNFISRFKLGKYGQFYGAIGPMKISCSLLEYVKERRIDIDMALGFFINQFEIDETKYHGIVERNRNNGRKGGAPIGNCNAKSKQPKQPSGLNSTQTTQNKLNDNDNDNDIYKESPDGDKKTIPKNKEVDLSFVSEDFKGIFKEWLEYKRERKENYKSEKSLKMCYNRLLTLSGNDCNKARLVVEQSIASNYAGLFELKNYGARQNTDIYEQKRIDSERRKSRLMAEFAEADAKFLAEQEAKRKAVGSTGEIPNTIPDGG